MRIAQFQMHVYREKEKNIRQLEECLRQIDGKGVDLVAVGEMFTCPYETQNFPVYAEPEEGDTWKACSKMAREHRVYLSAGTVPEVDHAGRVYNTAYVFDREGKQIAKHRKVHLFDIDVKGGQRFKESDTLTAGDQCTVFDTEFGKIGICICFDLRFPELSRMMVERGAKIILVPASFNMTTGPMHWELLFRCRAVDNQCYMIGTSGARDESAAYIAWGHTLAVSPWGKIIREMDEKQGYMINEIDLEEVKRVREQLPLLTARRIEILK